MKRFKYLMLGMVLLSLSCQKALDETPQGVISGDALNTPANVEKMVIAAYSGLGNDNIHTSFSLWP